MGDTRSNASQYILILFFFFGQGANVYLWREKENSFAFNENYLIDF